MFSTEYKFENHYFSEFEILLITQKQLFLVIQQ